MADGAPITLDVTVEDGRTVLRPAGDWVARTLDGVEAELEGVAERTDPDAVAIDLTRLGWIDTAGAYVLGKALAKSAQPDADANFLGQHPSARRLMTLARDNAVPVSAAPRR